MGPLLDLHAAGTFDEFVGTTFRALASAAPCDFVSFLYRQPEIDYCCSRDSLGRVWSAEFARRQAELLHERADGIPPERLTLLATRSRGPAGDPPAAAAYGREVMAVMRFRHAVTLFIGTGAGRSDLSFTVHREEGCADFAASDQAVLALVRRYTEKAWLLLNERWIARTLMHGISLALRHYQRGTVMLDAHLRVLWSNRAARVSIQTWEHGGRWGEKPGRELSRLPEPILEACQRMGREWLGRPGTGAWPRSLCVRHPSTPQSATIRLVGARPVTVPRPNYLVEFEPAALAQDDTAQTGSSFCDSLTASESEIVSLVCEGLTNQEIADRLEKSLVSVKFHLHQIFKKAQVKSRTRLSVLLSRAQR